MRRNFSRWMVIVAVLFSLLSVSVAASEEYYDSLKMVEIWLKKEYSETPSIYRERYSELEKIRADKTLSKDQKIARLKQEFPKAFQKAERPLIYRPPLSWRIKSLSLGYDIAESTTQNNQGIEVWKAGESVKHSDEDSKRESIRSSHEVKAGASLGVKADANLSFNPLKTLSSGGEVHFQASGGYTYGREKSYGKTNLVTESQQRILEHEQKQLTERLHQIGHRNFHLTFMLTLINNTNAPMYCSLPDANISVYMDNIPFNKQAKPYDYGKLPKLTVAPHRSTDIVFRMELDTSTARDLVRRMASVSPTIDILNGSSLNVYSDTGSDMIEESRKITDIVPIRLNIPGRQFPWEIRQRHTSDLRLTTLREALMAVDKDVHASWKGYNVFRWEGKKLAAVSDVPFNAFAKEDKEERYLALLQIGNQVLTEVSDPLLDNPMPPEGVTLWVVDLDRPGANLPPALQKAVFEKVKSWADGSWFGSGKPFHQRRLGSMYYRGFYVKKDFVEAVKWDRKAAEWGDAKAQYNLGWSYEYSKGVKKNEAEAAKWYRKAAKQGLAQAQCNLGVCYKYGRGVEKDEAEAVKWYRKAAEQGYALAQNNLGNCYKFGRGVEKNEREAAKWYRKAAEQGDANAQYNLGICYAFGEGVAKDPAEAVKWYRKAVEQGLAHAQYQLGRCFFCGDGVEKNEAEAVKWYRKAAEQGHVEAQNDLGVCYESGKGVAKDPAEAVKWYRKSADQGYALAHRNLGRCYETGKGVVRNEAEAVNWYRNAAELGDAYAQWQLGVCYKYGWGGVEADEAEAVKWYRRAAAQGHKEAKEALERLGR